MTFFQPAFKINSKVGRTSLGLKCTQLLIICWFLPAGAANTDSVVSLMRICSTDAAYLSADVAIVCAGHARGVFNFVFLSSEGLNPVHDKPSTYTRFATHLWGLSVFKCVTIVQANSFKCKSHSGGPLYAN